VIHGKGSRSPGGESILKPALFEWIAEPPLDAIVQATAEASVHDGGSGATYLLLYP
jgi:DNA-nicking Smr family endonuclease